jgi:hypothetical protein
MRKILREWPAHRLICMRRHLTNSSMQPEQSLAPLPKVVGHCEQKPVGFDTVCLVQVTWL